MSAALTWWLLIEIIGLVGFPPTFLLLRALPDRGYNFSKVVGLLLMSYLLWIGASARVIPNERWALVLILALLAAVSLFILFQRRAEIRPFLTARWPYMLASELLFTIAYVVALRLRSDVVDVLPGERPMDMALINAVLRADHFPPQDPWLAGHSLNYYYFGHLMVAALTNLSGLPSRITFNLALALIAALSVSGAFGLAYNLLAPRLRAAAATALALAAPLLLMVLSNVVGLFELLAVHGVGSKGFYSAVDVAGLDGTRQSTAWYPTEWLWPNRSIAFVNGSVDRQFPFAKFMLGELHSENMAIPIILLLIAVALAIWYSPGLPGRSAGALGLYGFGALSLGALAVTQIWYAPALLFLLAGTFAARRYADRGPLDHRWRREALAFAVIMAVLSAVLFVPFFGSSFGAFKGFIVVEGEGATEPHHLLYMWLPLGWLAAVLAVAAVRLKERPPAVAAALAVPGAVLVLWVAAMLLDNGPGALPDAVADRFSNGSWLTVLVVAAVLAATVLAFASRLRTADAEAAPAPLPFALGLSALALLLMLGVELFWADDGFWPGFNTYIKANFLAWFFLSISGAYALYLLLSASGERLRRWSPGKLGLVGLTVAVLSLGLIYPVMSTLYTTRLFNEQRHLDLLWQIRKHDPPEYQAIRWLQDNVRGSPVVLEAAGESYSNLARVSAYTGLPTVLGWKTHEFHWRGGWAPQAGRIEAVQAIYQTTDASEAARLLRRYEVEYVYVGAVEREVYGEAGMGKFATFMDVAFSDGEVTIYRTRAATGVRIEEAPRHPAADAASAAGGQ
ncbi:MAG TPA: DUF2298 domain-containing protein [Dehalococcoidia bacterium]|nr:DUF2298 domain-containing protein [Dehalococcoidia bacterium]